LGVNAAWQQNGLNITVVLQAYFINSVRDTALK